MSQNNFKLQTTFLRHTEITTKKERVYNKNYLEDRYKNPWWELLN